MIVAAADWWATPLGAVLGAVAYLAIAAAVTWPDRRRRRQRRR